MQSTLLLTVEEVSEILRVSEPRVCDLVRQRILPAIRLGRHRIEASWRFRVTPETLRSQIQRGNLQAVRLGRTLRVRVDDLERVMETRKIIDYRATN